MNEPIISMKKIKSLMKEKVRPLDFKALGLINISISGSCNLCRVTASFQMKSVNPRRLVVTVGGGSNQVSKRFTKRASLVDEMLIWIADQHRDVLGKTAFAQFMHPEAKLPHPKPLCVQHSDHAVVGYDGAIAFGHLQKVKVINIVALGDTRVLSDEAAKPEYNAFFHVRLVPHGGMTFEIITNGNDWYGVWNLMDHKRVFESAILDQHAMKLNKNDQQLVCKAIQLYIENFEGDSDDV